MSAEYEAQGIIYVIEQLLHVGSVLKQTTMYQYFVTIFILILQICKC